MDNGVSFSSSGLTFGYTGTEVLPVITSISPAYGPLNTTFTVKGANFFSPGIDCMIGTFFFLLLHKGI